MTVSSPTLQLALRLRAVSTASTAAGMVLVIVMVGALFPAVGGSIGKLDLPEGVTELLGGADYGTLAGWMRSEIGAVYGPLVIGAVAITAAASLTAGEEEQGILAVVAAHPVTRSALVLAKAAAVAASVGVIAVGTFGGLVLGVAIGGGGIALGDLGALSVHLAFFGLATGALALALAAATGHKAVAVGGASAYAVLAFLVNGFAPLVDGLSWLKYTSSFYYYEENDPISNGVDLRDLVVLAGATALMTAFAALAIRRRDLRG
jgi:ABC-2 type transport system permease protein